MPQLRLWELYNMICLDNTDVIEGGASVAAVVDYQMHGLVGTTFTQLAAGVMGTTLTTVLYTAGAAVSVVSIILVNKHSSAVDVTLCLDPANGGNPRYLLPKTISLGTGYSLHTDGARITVMDTNGNIVMSQSGTVSDIAYDATSWNGVTTIAPSKNAVRDKIETLGIGDVTAAANIADEALALGDGGAKGIKALALGAADLKLFMNAAGTANEYANGMKIGTFSIDTATASGTQVVSGIGFKPSHVDFFASIPNTSEFSIGFDDGTNYYAGYNRQAVGADTWTRTSTDGSIFLLQSSGVNYAGHITTLGADGFTITWIKAGAKTGTAYIYYKAYR